MLRSISVYRHAVVNTPVARWALIARGTAYSNRFPVPSGGGLPHHCARSATTLDFSRPAQRSLAITACRLAESPKSDPFVSKASDGFVSSTAAPIATGWSDPDAGWELHPLKINTLHGSRRTQCMSFQPLRSRPAPDNRPEVLPFPRGYPEGSLHWLKITPQSMYWAVRFAAEVFGVKSFYMTESGATFDDDITPSGEVIDLHRREYLRSHLLEVHRAVAEGYDVRGYFLWSLLDNFEWAEGYEKRFGIVHVAFGTQKRTPKLSSQWYAEVIRANRIV